MKACSLKDKIPPQKKNQGVNRLQERQRSDGLEMMQHQSVFCVGFLPSDKNETEQGSLQYQRPLSPVICWEHGEWSLMLFCYQLSSVSLQMNCWYRLMSYSLSLLFFFFFWFLAAPLTVLAPSKFIWQGHTTLQSNLICLFISVTDGPTVPKLLWPWGDGKVMRHRVDIDHYWFNREATHSSLMLPFSFLPSNIPLSCCTCQWLGQDWWGSVRGLEMWRSVSDGQTEKKKGTEIKRDWEENWGRIDAGEMGVERSTRTRGKEILIAAKDI